MCSLKFSQEQQNCWCDCMNEICKTKDLSDQLGKVNALLREIVI